MDKSCPNQTFKRHKAVADEKKELEPEKHFEAIARTLYAQEFSWDIERALEFALFRTYAVPSISGLLAKTGEFNQRTRKRYDDTELILAEALEHGLDSTRGQAAIDRMNEMHRRFAIKNEDMLYVLSTFVCEPIRWLHRFGRRAMTPDEQRAWFLYYRGLGERMGIWGIPDTLAELVRWNAAYEVVHFRFAESNRQIAVATSDLLLGFYSPRWLFWAGRPVVRAFLDDPLLESMGFKPAPFWLKTAVLATMRIRSGALKLLPKRRHPRLLTQLPRPTYPEGYRIEELGTRCTHRRQEAPPPQKELQGDGG
ncbi:MAG: oxygenase MpaB family protein [Pseudomonadota bacterium]